MAVEKPTWKYKLEGDKQTASEMNQLAQSVIANAIELSNIEELVTNLADDDDLENTIINGVPVIREKTTKTYNPENYSGMGRVILRKNMVNGVNFLTQGMINQANTIYEVRYDFDLNGQEITVPEGCVLDFQGGSFSNGIMVFNNSTILGTPILNIIPNGTIKGVVNINWFGAKVDEPSFDNAVILNRVSAIFKNLYLPSGNYYYKTQIRLFGISDCTFDGRLTFNGDLHNTSTIVIESALSGAKILFNDRIVGNISGEISEINNKNTVGLEVINCNGCDFTISFITNFNNNIRISGIGFGGCSYNKFNIINNFNADILLRIYQEDKDGELGWANQNYITGNRFTSFSEFKRPSIAIYCKGGLNDSYNNVNALTFENISIESMVRVTPIQLYNVYSSKFLNFRNESNNSKFIYIDGKASTNNEYSISFGPYDLGIIDLGDETIDVPFTSISPSRIFLDIVSGLSASDNINVESDGSSYYQSNIFQNHSLGHRLFNPFSYSPTGLVFSNVAGKYIRILTPNSLGRIHVKYYDSQGAVYESNSPKARLIKNSTFNTWCSPTDSYGANLYIPNDTNIAKVFIGLATSEDIQNIEFNIKSNTSDIILDDVLLDKKIGNTANRPTNNYVGRQYFDTTLSKYICWNGTAWVNLNGTTLT